MSSPDYSVFDHFLQLDTWHSNHPTDEERFYVALHRVVTHSNFSPDAMGEYMKRVKGVTSEDHPFALTISDLVTKAWAVRDYLKYAN